MNARYTFTYNWRRPDGLQIKDEHREALHDSAEERAFEMIRKGYTSGQLFDNVSLDDSDGEDGVEYTGWWSYTKE